MRPRRGRPGRRPSSLRCLPRCTSSTRAAGYAARCELTADQITAAANRTKPVDSQPAAVCKALPHDRVALPLRGAASGHSANADRANLRAASLPNLVRDDPGLAALLSEGGCYGHDRDHGGCEQVEVSLSFEHGVILHALHHGMNVTICHVTYCNG